MNNVAAALDIVDMHQLNIKSIYPKKDLFHKNYIEKWIQSKHINYSVEDMWAIREECINVL
ncbi:hypothetical protein DID78_05480 [Candidatus Marinamargulisbacteria bacterium SCGC AG-343-D04]|nr:hypothetical protein DID78_05480 [Candidatus Marinamargulisbacteria bacterium SCGC AG-343-D04]